MVESKEKFYLYDRWYKRQSETEEKIIYVSIPENISSGIRMEINKKENKITVFSLEEKKVLNRIEISDIKSSNIELHYIDEICHDIELENNTYKNLFIEFFAIVENDIARDYQVRFLSKNKKNNLDGISNLLNKKIDMGDMNIESQKADYFIEFVKNFIFFKKKLIDIIELSSVAKLNGQKDSNQVTKKKLLVPQSLEIYDRVYQLIQTNGNKIILENTEDDIRTLRIKYDPTAQLITSVCLRIDDYEKQEGVLQIIPNDLNGITARYYIVKKTNIRVGAEELKAKKIRGLVIFDSSNQKISNSIRIITESKKIELVEHPYLANNYTNGMGNLLTIGNRTYKKFFGIASYAAPIFRNIDKKVFVKKLENPDN